MSGPMDTPDDPRRDVLPMIPHLRAYARSLAHRDSHLADDLVQDTLMLALQVWERFTPGTNLKAWLFQILRNRFHSLVSRKHMRSEIASDSLEELASMPAFQEAQPEVAAFKAAFARLSPNHREALVLHAVHGLPYEKIAEVCGCEIGTVKSRINRARNLLKEMLLGDRPLEGPLRPWRARRQVAAVNGKPRPVPIVVAPPVLAPAEPIQVQPTPKLRGQPCLADLERQIVQAEAEAEVARHRGALEGLGRARMATDGAEAALRLAEQRLALSRVHRERLLDGKVRLDPAPS